MGDELKLFRLTDIHIHGHFFLCSPPLTLHGLLGDGSCEFGGGGGKEEGRKEREMGGKRKEEERRGGGGGGEGREKRRARKREKEEEEEKNGTGLNMVRIPFQ